MSDPKSARMLFRAAERDLLTLRSMTADAPEESYGFHVQQTAEKALKAWLALLGETYPHTHNIETLRDLLADRGVATKSFQHLITYTPYAVEYRYLGVGSSTQRIQRDQTLRRLDALLARIRPLLRDGEM